MSSNSEFVARLQRVQSRQGQGVLMVGQDEQFVLPRKQPVVTSRTHEVAQNLIYPGSLLGAVLLGMIGVAVGRYAYFQLLSGAGTLQDPVSELAFVAIFGVVVSFVLSQAFKLTSKQHRGLQGLGVFLMVGLFHNLAHWLPGPASLAFSSDWVAETVATTPANSFRFGQQYFPLTATAAHCEPTAIAAAQTRPAAQTATVIPAKPTILVLDRTRKTSGRKVVRPDAPAAATLPQTVQAPALPTGQC